MSEEENYMEREQGNDRYDPKSYIRDVPDNTREEAPPSPARLRARKGAKGNSDLEDVLTELYEIYDQVSAGSKHHTLSEACHLYGKMNTALYMLEIAEKT